MLQALILIVVIAVVASIIIWAIDRQVPPFELKWIVRLVVILVAVIWICLILLRMAGVSI